MTTPLRCKFGAASCFTAGLTVLYGAAQYLDPEGWFAASAALLALVCFAAGILWWHAHA